MSEDNLPVASMACDVCGCDEPHSHEEATVNVERYARKAFEMWYALATRSQSNSDSTMDLSPLYRTIDWGCPSRWADRTSTNRWGKPLGPYRNEKVESYWQAFLAAWMCQPDRLAYWNERFHFDAAGNIVDMRNSESVQEAFGEPQVSWRQP